MVQNRSLLLFRPAVQAAAFAVDLEARLPGRFRPIAVPLTETILTDTPLPLEAAQGILLSSGTAVGVLEARGIPPGLPVWCVGDQTARRAHEAGFAAYSAHGDAAALVTLVLRMARPHSGPLLYLHGKHVATDIVGALAQEGLTVRSVVVYEERAAPMPDIVRARLAAGTEDVLAFFSPRMARLFAASARAGGWPLGRAEAVVISANVAEALAGLGLGRCGVARTPDRAGMIEALAKL